MSESHDVAMRVPDPRMKRRSALYRTFRSLFLSFLVFAIGAGALLYYAQTEFDRPGPLTGMGEVVVERGMNAEDIGQRLVAKGVIGHPWAFVLAAAYSRLKGGTLKAGEYEFPAGVSLRQVVDMIAGGKALTYRLTIPEGLTTAQILERLSAHGALSEENPASLAEGVLLPDTYVFTRGTSRGELVERMREAQTRVLDELWESRTKDLPVKTKEEALILASIVEKETRGRQERPRVAAVFVNRLRQGMRLQSDPRSSTGWSAARAGLIDQSAVTTSLRRPPTTPIASTACRRRRSPIPAARPFTRCSIRQPPTKSISSPTALADMPFQRRWPSMRRM